MRRLLLSGVLIAIAGATLSAVWSCRERKDAEKQLAELREAVERELPAGSSRAQVLGFLTSRGIEHSEGKDRIIYGGIPKVWEGGLTKSGIFLKFHMSDEDKLLRAEVNEVFTGP